jgi:hypothetical protein
MGNMGILWMASPMHRHVIYSAQFFDAVNMVVMAVGAQDGIQLQAVFMQKFQHGRGFARIYRDGVAFMLE